MTPMHHESPKAFAIHFAGDFFAAIKTSALPDMG
jgi:hypothetical protein